MLRGVQLFQEFLTKEKSVEREEHTIAAEELNEYLAEFIHSVRRKDGGVYKASSLRCLLSSTKSHLKKNDYPHQR